MSSRNGRIVAEFDHVLKVSKVSIEVVTFPMLPVKPAPRMRLKLKVGDASE